MSTSIFTPALSPGLPARSESPSSAPTNWIISRRDDLTWFVRSIIHHIQRQVRRKTATAPDRRKSYLI